MGQKLFLLVLISGLLITPAHSMQLAIPVAKAIATGSVAQQVISNKWVNKQLISVLQQLNLLSADAELNSLREQLIVYATKQLAHKSALFLADQGLLKLDPYYAKASYGRQVLEINKRFLTAWEKNYPATTVSETDTQRAISYIAIFLPVVQNIARLYELVTHIIAYEKEQDKRFRYGLERDPKAHKIYQAAMTKAVIELLTFACNARNSSFHIGSLITLNQLRKMHFNPNNSGKFGRKFNKALQALHNICLTPETTHQPTSSSACVDSNYLITHDNHKIKKSRQIEEVTLEFLKEISDTPEQYCTYLEQARTAGLTRAQEYLDQEHTESCFYKHNSRVCKKLTHKWLTDWAAPTAPMGYDVASGQSKKNLSQQLIHQTSEVASLEAVPLVYYIPENMAQPQDTKKLRDNMGSAAIDTSVSSVSMSHHTKHGFSNVPASTDSQSDNQIIITVHPVDQPVDITPPAVTGNMQQPEMPITPVQQEKMVKREKQAIERIAKLTDAQVLETYAISQSIRTHPEFLKRLASAIKTSGLKQTRQFIKQLSNNDFMRFYNLLARKLTGLSEFKKLEERILKLSKNTRELKQLSSLVQQEVLEQAGKIEHEAQIIKSCKMWTTQPSSFFRNQKMLEWAKLACANTQLRIKLEEQIPNFTREVAKIMQEKLARLSNLQALQPSQQQLLAQAFEAREIANSNLAFLQLLTGDLRQKFMQLQEKARAIAAHNGYNFDTSAQIIQRFTIPASSIIITHNQQNNCLDIQHNLLSTLDQLSRVKVSTPETDMLYTSTVKNLVRMTVHAIQQNNYAQASMYLCALENVKAFISGAAEQAIDSAGSVAVSLAAQKSLQAFLQTSALATIRLATAPVALGMFACNLYSNSQEAKELISATLTAYESGDFNTLGKLSVKIGALSFDVHCFLKILNNCARAAFKSGKIAQFVPEVKQGITQAQQILTKQTAMLELHAQFTQTPIHNQLRDEAIKLGTSAQAWERRVRDLCIKLSTPDAVVVKLKEANALTGLRLEQIPKGLKKPLKLVIDHSIKFEIDKKGKLRGWHFDEHNHLFKDKNIKVLWSKTAQNGMYIVRYEVNGQQKTSTFFCNKRNNSISLHNQVLKELSAHDYTKQAPKPNGKYAVVISFQNGLLHAEVNATTGEVHTFYPMLEEWKDLLTKS